MSITGNRQPSVVPLGLDEAVTRVAEQVPAGWPARYFFNHEPRYRSLVATIAGLAPDGPDRIMDIGPGMQTDMMRLIYPTATIDGLGMEPPEESVFFQEEQSRRDHERHVPYDLDRLSVPDTWPAVEPTYDIVLMSEVLEHLNVRPVLLMDFLASMARPGGHVIVTTPNAAYLLHRARALLGRQPAGPNHDMTGSRCDPRDFRGHFRMYTIEEVAAVGEAAGLELVAAEYRNEFRYHHRRGRAVEVVVRLLPKRFHQQIVAVFRRPA